MSYAVKEIYHTLQGEGFHTGRPAVLARFAGCNLWSGLEADRSTAICQFCDTDFGDVGLTSNGEDVDAIALHTDGRIMVSTTGGFSGTGASGSDEDLFLFTGTLGSSTSGSFERYFDGSDVGLSGAGARDVDAAGFDASGALALSIVGNSTVGGIATSDEDVLDFTGTFGSSTSGSYSMRLDLSALGIAATEDIGSLFVVD